MQVETMQDRYDVVVVGGGAAGLSAALTLSRARRSVLVVDAGAPRNAPAKQVHNYLGREGASPGDLLASGRAEVTGYGGEVVTGRVVSATALPSAEEGGSAVLGFAVALADGRSVLARRLLVTTGLVDELPGIPGLAQRWGRDVLHCPYCHGWEVRDRSLGILASGPFAVHQALLFRQWSADVTLFLHDQPAPGADDLEQLTARGIGVVPGEVVGLQVADDRLSGVRLASGDVVPCEAVVVAPRFTARADVLAALGIEATPMEMGGHVFGSQVAADPSGATEVLGVWVAGNVADLRAQVITAAAGGVNTAAAINSDLIAEDVRAAVTAHRLGDGASQQYWEGHYGKHQHQHQHQHPDQHQHQHRATGDANPVLVEVARTLSPGTALDLGCGHGSDAIWLAKRGWHVTAVDVSPTALERAAGAAAEAGLTDQVDWQHRDLADSFPDGSYDLVSAHYLHSPATLPQDDVLRRAASAVAPGGTLLLVGHAEFPPWSSHDADATLPSPRQVQASLDLPAGSWHTVRAERVPREVTGPEGQPATLVDCVVEVARLP